jgi:hypothetical protein
MKIIKLLVAASLVSTVGGCFVRARPVGTVHRDGDRDHDRDHHDHDHDRDHDHGHDRH